MKRFSASGVSISTYSRREVTFMSGKVWIMRPYFSGFLGIALNVSSLVLLAEKASSYTMVKSVVVRLRAPSMNVPGL